SGERVLSLLEEKPIIDEIADNENRNIEFDGITLDNISFKYDDEKIIDDMTFAIKKGDTVGIYGRSGSGKSTLLKLIMRFWDIDGGDLKIS
ncbi:ATP-binding cassette domain-containing protein, partial [Escherichia coli]|uniref:ATP-binding cassette domain-containing protein n=1 Tax=Escherichia coli TaxID=562 RepID=UPI003C0756C2